ncbi:MAG: DUF1971 domain-containing protein [Pseudomonadales bacterium]
MSFIPTDCEAYKRTPTFTETTIPAGLLRRHSTKAGVWGKIVVEEGSLLYRALEPQLLEVELTPDARGGAARQAHEVAPLGSVRFHVEFYRKKAETTE